MSEATRFGAPLRRWSGRGSRRQAFGCSRGGFSSEVHLRANAVSLPTDVMPTPSETHDTVACGDHMDWRESNPDILLGGTDGALPPVLSGQQLGGFGRRHPDRRGDRGRGFDPTIMQRLADQHPQPDGLQPIGIPPTALFGC